MGTRPPRRICFVTGTRAEFGLMRTTLLAIQQHPNLKLQIVATGMHLDPRHGQELAAIKALGFNVDEVVPWKIAPSPSSTAAATGLAIARLANVYHKLQTDIVLVVGDRVEAFAAASAAHLCRLAVAHVHGGDRALGQVDDSLRHAITKLAHIHFPATAASARRIERLGEEPWRIHRVGSPGVDGMKQEAQPWRAVSAALPALKRHRYALLVLHPDSTDEKTEARRAALVLNATLAAGFDHIVIIYPNNDPGSAGIIARWRQVRDPRVIMLPDTPRPRFLGLLANAAALVGNSSSGIIEAASFGTPVVDIGPRQSGRERGRNVVHVEYQPAAIGRALDRIWNHGKPRRSRSDNVYGGDGAGKRIEKVLSQVRLDLRTLRKLIRY